MAATQKIERGWWLPIARQTERQMTSDSKTALCTVVHQMVKTLDFCTFSPDLRHCTRWELLNYAQNTPAGLPHTSPVHWPHRPHQPYATVGGAGGTFSDTVPDSIVNILHSDSLPSNMRYDYMFKGWGGVAQFQGYDWSHHVHLRPCKVLLPTQLCFITDTTGHVIVHSTWEFIPIQPSKQLILQYYVGK